MGKLLEDREFKPGTTGWTAEDLEHPEIEKLWNANHYEIVEGVLAQMPPAYFDGQASLMELVALIRNHLVRRKLKGCWAPEADFIVGETRVAKPDMVLLLSDKLEAQRAMNRRLGKTQFKYGRIRVAPTLVIESVSAGHESHDRVLKRRWYAEFGVRNYWILDGLGQTLECLILDGEEYKLDVMGRKSEKIRPQAFPGLVIPLGKIWL
jgi:Uma2 family endonuclease